MPHGDLQAFNDPVYQQILGLEGGATITDWYALLGVEKFESDEAKLDEAMLRRFERVRRYQVGNYQDQALRLIDELGRAYTTLTSDEDRHEYDQTLEDGVAVGELIETGQPVEVVETSSVAATDVVSGPVRETEPATTDKATCPRCGKPTSPKAPVCYQCGYKKPSALEQRAKENKRDVSSSATSVQDLVRQDLTPQQLLSRLKEMRKFTTATKRAVGLWRGPTSSNVRQRGAREASSHCRNCNKGLMHASDAHALLDSEVRGTVEFVQSYARKLEALGRASFDWPLRDEDLREVQQQMPELGANSVGLYCRGCALRFFRSPKVAS